MSSTLIFAFLAALAVAGATNYCDKTLCEPGDRHVACGHSGRFANTCSRDARLVDMRPHVHAILKLHNEKRNLVAGGGLKGFLPAARMATVQWDDELARLATLNVKKCNMEHDQCYNTHTFRYSGQNLYLQWGSGLDNDDSSFIENAINGWFSEHKYCKMNFINSYPDNYAGPAIGHFTQLVVDKNIRVGCAISRYYKTGDNYILFACNYAFTNVVTQPIYETSKKAASKCRTGTNPEFKNLCSKAEKYEF